MKKIKCHLESAARIVKRRKKNLGKALEKKSKNLVLSGKMDKLKSEKQEGPMRETG